MDRRLILDRWRGRRMALAAVVAAFAVLLALTTQARALDCEGIDLGDGCLFTITGGDTPESDDGYAVTNVLGVPMWDFVRDKSAQAIGYPISQRWVDGPFTLQAFQKVILQWDPGKQRMNYYNTLDVLANRYPDVELPFVPAHQVLEADRGADFATITRNHLALLDQNEAIKDRFLSEPDWLNLYGLPIRYEEREVDGQAGGVQMLRAQRTVFVVWNVPAPGTTVGRVSLQNVPDKVKKLSNVIIPEAAKVPATRDGRINAAIEEIAWVQDGLGHGEAVRVEQLRELATLSPPAFWALVRNRGIHATSAYSRDLEPTRTVGEIIGRIGFIAHTSPVAAEMLATMPFLDTFDGIDLVPLSTLLMIVLLAPDELEPTISHLASVGGLTDEQRTSLPLLHLKQRHPEAARALEALPWIQDGISPPPQDNDGSPIGHSNEAHMLTFLMEWQMRGYRSHLSALLSRPWFQDGLDQREHAIVFNVMSEITSFERRAALQILNMPFLQTIGEGDLTIVDILNSVAVEGDLQGLLSRPALRDGIRDGQIPLVALEYLSLRDPSAAAAIRAVPWLRDGISVTEVGPVVALQKLALESTQLLNAILDKDWVLDGINPDELSIVKSLTYMVSRDESRALSIVQMPFLETVEAADDSAVDQLAQFHHNSTLMSYLNHVLSHPNLGGGARDEHVPPVTALLSVAYHADPESRSYLYRTLLDPDAVTIEQRVITLPLSGDVLLAVVRTRDGAANSMDWLERSLRSHEHFMGVALPGNYVSILVADVGRGGGGPSGILYFSATHREPGGVIAHESAHIYMAFAPRWLAEGGATFLEWIAVNQGAPPHNFRIGVDSCESARSLSELEQKTPSVIDSGSICHYSMGFGLFYDLYNSLGDAEFRRGFRELYLRLLASPTYFTSSEERNRLLDRDPSASECSGAERIRCFLRIQFVAGAADPAIAAIASDVIDRWYYGP